jgi:hypothetical protein
MADKTPNYSPEQEARLRSFETIDNTVATMLATEFGKTPASVRAKAVRMGLNYVRKQPETKSGAPVERKEAIVAQIASLVDGNLDGLDKAPKLALQALRDALVA